MKVHKESHKFPFSPEWAATNVIYVNTLKLRLVRVKNEEMRQFIYRLI